MSKVKVNKNKLIEHKETKSEDESENVDESENKKKLLNCDKSTSDNLLNQHNDQTTINLDNNFLDETKKFSELSLDNRLSKAISSLGFIYPTKIQASSINLALQGRDICVNARTGSGKTLSYAIPIIQQVLINKKNNINQSVQGLILVPTNELCDQVHTIFKSLLKFCGNIVSIASMASEKSININTQAHLLKSKPGIYKFISFYYFRYNYSNIGPNI